MLKHSKVKEVNQQLFPASSNAALALPPLATAESQTASQTTKLTCKPAIKISHQFRGRITGKIPRKRYAAMEFMWERKAIDKKFKCFFPKNKGGSILTGGSIGGPKVCAVDARPCR